jgi:hypothetical protein
MYPIENWLELEAGVSPFYTRNSMEWDTDFLVKKPWTLSSKAEFMLGTLGLGVNQGLWTLQSADAADPASGALEIKTSIRTIPIFFAASAESALKLSSSGRLASTPYSVVIHSKTVVEPKHRSPARIIMRTGVVQPRSVSISDLLKTVSTAAELTQCFQREVAL